MKDSLEPSSSKRRRRISCAESWVLPLVVEASWDWLMVAAGSSSADWQPTFPSSLAAVVVGLKTVATAAAETSEDCWLTASSSRVSFRV